MSDRKLTSASFEGNSEFHKLFAAELSGASPEGKARATQAIAEALAYVEKKRSLGAYGVGDNHFNDVRSFIMDIDKCRVWSSAPVSQDQKNRERAHVISLLAKYYGVDLSAEA